MRKATDDQLIESYTRLGNIWKVAEEFGMCGQSVWERLKRLGYEDKDKWTEAQLNELREAYSGSKEESVDINNLALKFGRHKSNVSRKARELGLTSRTRKKNSEYCLELGIRSKEWIRKNGHPRGYREMRVCPVCGKFFEVRHSCRVRHCSKRCSDSIPRGEERFTNRKGGRRADLGGLYFRSSWEANYARYLNFLRKSGETFGWSFEHDTFEFNKIKKGTRFYTPDFKLTYEDGSIEYHEVKGWDYPRGRTARKRFAKYFPHLKLVLIDSEWFKAIKKQGIDKLIPYWE